MGLQVDQREISGRVVLVCYGSVDLSTLPALQSALGRAIIAFPGQTITVDLDEVDSLDDAGLGIILGAAGRARRGGGDLVVVCSREAIRERLTLTRFDRAVTVSASLTAS